MTSPTNFLKSNFKAKFLQQLIKLFDIILVFKMREKEKL